MSQLENFAREARQIESEIARAFIALGIDLDNPAQLRRLAREALNCNGQGHELNPGDPEQGERMKLFGLVQLMLTVMRESAQEQQTETHGGPYWKAFSRALWAEHEGDQASRGNLGQGVQPSEVGAGGTALP